MNSNVLENVKQFLLKELDAKQNQKFNVSVNYRPLVINHNGSPRNIFIMNENKDGNNILVVGYRVPNDRLKPYVTDKRLEDILLSILASTKVADYDLDQYIEQDDPRRRSPVIHSVFAPELFSVNFVTDYYKTFIQMYTEDSPRSFSITPTSEDIPQSVCVEIVNRLDTELLRSYKDSLRIRLLNKVQNNRDIARRFFNIRGIFLPIFVKSMISYCPFLESKRYKETFQLSMLYAYTENLDEVASGMNVRYVTSKDFCRAIKSKAYLKLNTLFALDILLGLVNSNFPNSNTMEYVRVAGEGVPRLNRDEYIKLTDDAKEDFTAISSLAIATMANERTLRLKSSDILRALSDIELRLNMPD